MPRTRTGSAWGLILFIAVLGSILLTVCLGTARIMKLPRFVRRENHRADAREAIRERVLTVVLQPFSSEGRHG